MKINSLFIWNIHFLCIYLQKIYRNAVNIKNIIKLWLELIEIETLKKVVSEAVSDAIASISQRRKMNRSIITRK
jgi:hypothetical protein